MECDKVTQVDKRNRGKDILFGLRNRGDLGLLHGTRQLYGSGCDRQFAGFILYECAAYIVWLR